MPDRAMAAELDTLFTAHMAMLTQQLADGEIDLGTWQVGVRADIRRAHALQMVAGNSGAMPSADDWLRLGPTIKAQDAYLQDFARGIADGSIDPATAGARAGLYAKAAGAEYSRQALKDVNLPAHPKDGSTPCLSNCGCEWQDNGDGTYSWVRGLDDSCKECKRREIEWANYQPEAA
jgi:hypothetical protein